MPVVRVPSPSPYAPLIGFSAAVRYGNQVVVAGTTAVGPDGTVVGADAYEQAVEALRKIEVALREVGAELCHVVSTRVYLGKADDWELAGRAHGEAFADLRPAATMVVAGLLDPGMLVEVEAIAWVED